jgi:hypothetical protein
MQGTGAARVSAAFFAGLTLASSASAQSSDGPALIGYTCCNLHFEGDWISDANWSALPMLAAGTPVRTLEYGKYRVTAEVAGRRMRLGLDYWRKQGLADWARSMIVQEDPKPRIARWPAPVRDAVLDGKVAIGMTKEQVIASVGYPPAHETPSLDAVQWKYWYGTHDTYLVSWDGSGLVKEVIAEPQIRSAVMSQGAVWLGGTPLTKAESPAVPISGEQRAAIHSASVAESVSEPDRPEIVIPVQVVGIPLLDLAVWLAQKEFHSQELKKFMTDNKIDIGSIVRDEFTANLSRGQAFNEVVADKGDVGFQLKIETYGLAFKPAGRGNAPFLQPFLRLAVELSTPDGKIVWQKSVGHASLEVFANQMQTGEAFRKVAQVAAKELLRDLPSFGTYAQPPTITASQSSVALTSASGSPIVAHVGPLPAAGTTWQYAYTMRGVGSARYTIGVRVTSVEGGVVHESITIPSSPEYLVAVSADSLSFRSFQLPRSQTLVELAPYLHSVLAKSGGATWSNLAGYPSGNAVLAPWTITVREFGQEEVTVPAGTFKATRIEVSGRRTGLSGGNPQALPHESGRFQLRAWYAPQVRRYVRLQHETWSLSGNPFGVQLVELTSFVPR